jgi:hypothetical protein
MTAGRFREQAALCQRLAKVTLSAEMAQRLTALAAEYESIACQMDRARRIHRPDGDEAPVAKPAASEVVVPEVCDSNPGTRARAN